MKTYKKLLKYVPELKHYAYISTILSALASVLAVLPYWYIWKFANELLVNENLIKSKEYAITIVVIMIAYGAIYMLAVWFSHLLGFRLETNLRKEGIEHLMSASFAFFDMNSSGKIRKIIDDNASETHSIVAHLIPDIAAVITTPILVLVITYLVDVQLFIFTIIVLLLGIMLIKGMTGNTEFMRYYYESLERLNSETVEYVRGMQVVKIFRGTVQSFKSFYDAIVDYSKYVLEYTMSCRSVYVIFQLLLNVFVVCVIPYFVIIINNGGDIKLSLAKIIYYATISGILMVTFMKVMYVGMNSFLGYQAVEKLENLFIEMDKDKISHGDEDVFESSDIEFKNVSFRYLEDFVLKDISFKLDENRTYALVGTSGSGKSTIAKLISGFYKIESGELLIGGRNISEYSENALMDNIAFVFQNSKLFKTTIFENVQMGNVKASHKEVMNALYLARCEDILDKFEMRENTVIGSKGVYLSGGEIQRIAIARAILKDAKIVILDEASAAADPENEYEIQQAFTNLMKDKTVIMIAHRLSSIKNVDEILVVEGGKIIERGRHEDLMSYASNYKRMQGLFEEANDWRIYD